MSFYVQDRVDSKALCRYIKALKKHTSYLGKLYALTKESGQKTDHIKDLASNEVKFLYITTCLEIMGQAPLLNLIKASSDEKKQTIMDYLESLDTCFAPAGGLLAYQESVLALLDKKEVVVEDVDFSLPKEHDLTDEKKAKQLAYQGLIHLNEVAALFPIGGAADRLNRGRLVSVASANFSFFGKTLLKRLIEDISSSESLYFKLFKQQVIVPLFLMVSSKKEHLDQIHDQLEKSAYFSRPRSLVTVGIQPLVPLFNEKGIWHTDEEGKLSSKPGGHGMLWKVAIGEGWMEKMLAIGKHSMVVRQINNPMAGTDNVLLAFQGLGFSLNGTFGALGCAKKEGMKEGTWAIKKKGGEKPFLTNVEYCESVSSKLASGDVAGQMLANTNILFASIEQVIQAVKKDPFPGKLLNFRTDVVPGGKLYKLARLETMMQNISEHFGVGDKQGGGAFVALAQRSKTMSCTKKLGNDVKPELETPGMCLLDFMHEARHLLTKYCNSTLPDVGAYKPSFLFAYHRALGPFYQVIGQKISGLHVEKGAFVQFEIAELYIHDCKVHGSLIIEAEQVMGHRENGVTVYSDKVGSCVLERVRVTNKGADFSGNLWDESFDPGESLTIRLEGCSRFVAKDVTFKRAQTICVPDGVLMQASQGPGGEVVFQSKKLEGYGQLYDYSSDSCGEITLKKRFS